MISVSQSIWNERCVLCEVKDRVLQLYNTINFKNDLYPYQWCQLIAVTLEFKPNLIIELGRGGGNSTCAFLLAGSKISPLPRITSVCLSTIWRKHTFPKIRHIISQQEVALLDIHEANILTFEFEKIISDARRILVFWDAHGFDVAACVLGKIMPLLQSKQHIVIMHDLSDNRYLPSDKREYRGNSLWKGNNNEGQRVWLGNIDSAVEQAVAIVDFTSRNKIELHSATHELHEMLGHDEEKKRVLTELIGSDLFSLQAHWFWFSLNEAKLSLTFPTYVVPKNNNIFKSFLYRFFPKK
ncbi:TPA: hypothetical protein ENS27_01425 [bacterium]|nr:hypothetical protein [bacterium]